MVKCPVLDEFALKLFDTERAVNIKLSQQTGLLSVPWATMLGEVNIPEPIPMDSDLARIGIVWEKEGQVKLPKKKLHSLLCTRSDYRCLVITFFHIFLWSVQGVTLEEYLSMGKDLYGVLSCRETPLQAKNLLRPELCRNVLGQMLIALIQVLYI